MKLFAAILLSIFGMKTAFAAPSGCFNNSQIQEKSELLSLFKKNQFDDFEKKFQALCDKYSANLICSIETPKTADAGKKMMELTSKSPCAEVMRVDGKEVTKLYYINDKPKK